MSQIEEQKKKRKKRTNKINENPYAEPNIYRQTLKFNDIIIIIKSIDKVSRAYGPTIHIEL